MDKKNVIDFFIAQKGDWFPAEQVPAIRQRLEAMDEERLMMVTSFEFKSPVLMLVLSILVGELGVDRFLLGEVGLGVLKLITCGGCGVWWLVDLFLVMGRTRKANLTKIMTLI